LDTSDEKEVSSVFSQINDSLGSIDVLVNNAGISGTNAPTHEISESDWQKVIDINVNGVFFCTKHAVGHVGKPDDIAYGILYLASDEAGFVTGSELVIDGGYTAQ
jgi:NAD(P)-dependent dehydrogenase (short-subunit alcohol dehydrogenase family)